MALGTDSTSTTMDTLDSGASSQPAAGPPALRSLHGELVLLVAEQSRRIPIQAYLTSALMALLLVAYVPVLPLALWFVSTVLVIGVRTWVIRRLPDDASRTDLQKLHIIAPLYWISALAQAAVLLFFPLIPIVTSSLITIFLAGIAAAALHATAGFRRIYLPYVILIMTPVAIVWVSVPNAAESNLERVLYAALVLMYVTTMLSHAKGAYGVFVESYNIRLQRSEFNEKLRDALASAEAANRAKTRFLASASHDLRQPIHALSLFSGSLLLRPMDPRTTAIAQQIDKSVTTLATQLDALLDISRLDAGVIEKSIAVVDLQALLAQLFEEARPLAQAKDLDLRVSCEEGLRVRTDPMLFQRILRNLLINAIKYTDAGSVAIRVERRASGYLVHIEDTGRGIPKTEQGRVFEEFYQLANPERDRTKGLGLGLAIVRRLTELLGLEIGLESAPGVGSRFSIEVPAADPHDIQVNDMNNVIEASVPDIKVLVVDDEEVIRLGMTTLLEEMGFSVRCVASTQSALQAAGEFEPAIVLADFRLRGEDDGLLAIRALRAIWPGLPALLISGDTAPERLLEARKAGIELLHKPVNAGVLRDAMLHELEA